MATAVRVQPTTTTDVNGAAMAATLAAGVGAFALAAFVVLNEAGLFAAPALYGPAGGVTGRTTCATVIWLVAWGVLHFRWRTRHIAPAPAFAVTVTLIALAILGTFPPIWALL